MSQMRQLANQAKADDAGPTNALRFYDAHNHLQDERLTPHREGIFEALAREGIVKMVVNGATESDWRDVLELAHRHSQVLPSFGLHPWYVNERSSHWQQHLREMLDSVPSAVGEIGLDRWIKDYDMPAQEEVFVWQLRTAAERDLPVSIHCLQAWGRLVELLRKEPRPARGFVLHSFGGSAELVQPLADLGAYFSLPGYFACERKMRQRETFKRVPLDRLLIETDAPDQCLPPERVRYPLIEAETGKPINHPANLGEVYRFAAELLEKDLASLVAQVEVNFQRLFLLN
jgi:TatD DNase family protein